MFPMHSSDGHWTRRRFLTDLAFVAGTLVAASWLGTKGCSRPVSSPSETPGFTSPSGNKQCPPNSIRAKGDYVGGSTVRAHGACPDPQQTPFKPEGKVRRPRRNNNVDGGVSP